MIPYSVLVQRCDVDRVSSYLRAVLGLHVEVVPGEDRLARARVVGLEISVFRCEGFEDDSGIEFSKFETIIDVNLLRMPADQALLVDVQESVARLIGATIAADLNTACLVVRNLQQRIWEFGS